MGRRYIPDPEKMEWVNAVLARIKALQETPTWAELRALADQRRAAEEAAKPPRRRRAA